MRVHVERGSEQSLTEIYLIGNTKSLDIDDMQNLPGVERVVRVSAEYRILGRHKDEQRPMHFDYNGVHFGQDTLHVFAGLCAVDNREHVEIVMKAVRDARQVCAHGRVQAAHQPLCVSGAHKNCLPYVFELAGKYGIKVIAMEITHESHRCWRMCGLRARLICNGSNWRRNTRTKADNPDIRFGCAPD